MEIDLPALVVSLIVGAVGFVLFSYGRSMKRPPQTGVGLVLMVFPYFAPNLWWTAGIALVLCAALWVAVRFGW